MIIQEKVIVKPVGQLNKSKKSHNDDPGLVPVLCLPCWEPNERNGLDDKILTNKSQTQFYNLRIVSLWQLFNYWKVTKDTERGRLTVVSSNWRLRSFLTYTMWPSHTTWH